MKEYLKNSGMKVISIGLGTSAEREEYSHKETLQQILDNSKTVIFPVPATKDKVYIFSLEEQNDFKIENIMSCLNGNHLVLGGCLTQEMVDECERKNIKYYDFMENQEVTWLNGIATAEGAIMEAVRGSECNIHHSNVLVLGYGKCGKILAHKLKALDAYVTIGAKTRDLAEATTFGHKAKDILSLKDSIRSFEFIFNTIPDMILKREILELISPETTIIDIASAPGGLDYEFAKERKLNVHHCLGIPGKISPKTSGRILGKEVQFLLMKNNIERGE